MPCSLPIAPIAPPLSYFTVDEAFEEGIIDKLVPGYSLNRFRKMKKDQFGDDDDAFYAQKEKPKFTFKRADQNGTATL